MFRVLPEPRPPVKVLYPRSAPTGSPGLTLAAEPALAAEKIDPRHAIKILVGQVVDALMVVRDVALDGAARSRHRRQPSAAKEIVGEIAEPETDEQKCRGPHRPVAARLQVLGQHLELLRIGVLEPPELVNSACHPRES